MPNFAAENGMFGNKGDCEVISTDIDPVTREAGPCSVCVT